MVPEYIDREKSLQTLTDHYNKMNLIRTHPWYCAGFQNAVGLLERIEKSDAAPVIHAFWDSDEKCSHCGIESTEGLDAEKWNYWMPPFCPHCGAIMDLEVDE